MKKKKKLPQDQFYCIPASNLKPGDRFKLEPYFENSNYLVIQVDLPYMLVKNVVTSFVFLFEADRNVYCPTSKVIGTCHSIPQQ